MTNILAEIKEILHKEMILYFESNGFITPMLFLFKDGEPFISIIPYEMLADGTNRQKLANAIKNMCQEPNVLAVGIIMEAYGVKMGLDNPDADKIINDKFGF